MKQSIIERFVKYAKINTQSDPKSSTVPSTMIQLELANILVNELNNYHVEVDFDQDKGYIYGMIKANTKKSVPVIGYIAHMDTAPDYSGLNVSPQIIEKYDGSAIKLNDKVILDPDVFLELKGYVGKTLITTNGETLLGSDDKSGIVAIMEIARYYFENPDVEHGNIAIGFTVDEEIGKGADHFDVKRFGADFAYTIDGGEIGEFSYENFNAASVNITFWGKNVHPGSAKNKLKNAILAQTYLNTLLPEAEVPEKTELREGFYHLCELNGNIEKSHSNYIIRDHSKENFLNKKSFINSAFELTKIRFNIEGEIEINDQYYNMKEKIVNEKITSLVTSAMCNLNISLKDEPIRGGTDGARLSFRGLPCPNIFTGGHNFHGPYEYLVVDSLISAIELLKEINKLNLEQ